MIWTIYLVILIYFVLGFIGFYFINRKKEHVEARKSWLKYFTYFIIIHILFFSIAFFPALFRIICLIIIAGGLYEIIKVYIRSGNNKQFVFYIALLVYSLLSIGFYVFSGYNKGLILFSFLIISIFDSFSQIIGQIWGRRKLFRKISLHKTVEGFIGGILVAVASAWLLVGLLAGTDFIPMRLATGIVFFAFLGDMITSMYKRKYGVKDFSTLIPGHGGFLDRFDSLIAGGAFVAITVLFFNG
ncbi:MAG TPA: phosphatidate cytidylyltransferase [Mariniphaga sp.]|nr:phosphatidate cytidylyltransferase [Mariniphaga sp.]